MKRRTFLLSSAAGLIAGSRAPFARAAKTASPFASFDTEIETFMGERKTPGGALAVVKDGRLVYARGYGFADRDRKIPARADSLFRIASISKPFTAVAVLQLVEQGKLKLDDRVLDIIKFAPLLAKGAKPDPRLATITVRQCLQHTGGWDRDASFDPMFRPKTIADAAGVPGPAGPAEVIRYMLGQPMDFDPGQRYAYSNFGYCVLGRVIEKVTGSKYDAQVRRAVLEPAGIKAMRIGGSLDGGRAENEVRYYTPDEQRVESVFPRKPGEVPWPYGGFHLEAMDAHGGWIASAVDLARFAAALDERSLKPLLRAESIKRLEEPPPAPVARGADGKLKETWYGCGWNIRPQGRNDQSNRWHGGSLPGTHTLLVRRGDGLSWAILFNQRSKNRDEDRAIDPALHRAAAAVTDWPAVDLFPKFHG